MPEIWSQARALFFAKILMAKLYRQSQRNLKITGFIFLCMKVTIPCAPSWWIKNAIYCTIPTYFSPKMSKCSAVPKILTSIVVRGLLQRITWATNDGPRSRPNTGNSDLGHLSYSYNFLDKIKNTKTSENKYFLNSVKVKIFFFKFSFIFEKQF